MPSFLRASVSLWFQCFSAWAAYASFKRRLVTLLVVFLCVADLGFAQGAAAPKAAKKESPSSWVSPLAKTDTTRKPLPPTVKHATFNSPSMGIAVGYYIYLPRVSHEFLSIPEVPHTAAGSYEKKGDEIMRHHQRTFDAHRPK